MVAGGKYQVLRISGRARGFPRVSTRAWWSGKAFWPVMQGSVPGRGSRSPEALRPDGVACEEQQGSGRGQEMSSERWPPRGVGLGAEGRRGPRGGCRGPDGRRSRSSVTLVLSGARACQAWGHNGEGADAVRLLRTEHQTN